MVRIRTANGPEGLGTVVRRNRGMGCRNHGVGYRIPVTYHAPRLRLCGTGERLDDGRDAAPVADRSQEAAHTTTRPTRPWRSVGAHDSLPLPAIRPNRDQVHGLPETRPEPRSPGWESHGHLREVGSWRQRVGFPSRSCANAGPFLCAWNVSAASPKLAETHAAMSGCAARHLRLWPVVPVVPEFS
jgi:hypothetical protein